MKSNLNLLVPLILSVLLLPVSIAVAEDAQGTPVPQGEKLFYASHSLMWYVPELLGELAAARGIEGHQLLGLQKLGASRTLQHWQLPDGDNKAKQALKTGQVGVFVMSPIQLPDEGLENFVKLGLQHNPDMRFLVQLSWGGGDIDNQEFPKGAWSVPDRNKTPEQLAKMNVPNIKAGEAQIKELNKRYGKGKDVVFLIPTAQAAAELRSRIYRKEIPGLTSQDELFVDPAHPSPPLEALNTYLHYAVLYQESPVGLPMIDLLKRANRPEWDEKLNRTLQEIAWQTARNYPYSGIKEPKSSQVSGSLPAEKSFAVPELELVYTSYVDIGKPLHVGKMPEGERRVIPITGGTFKGPKMQGEIIPGGADWNLSRADGATVAEANYFLRTDDGVVIRISNWGVGAPPTGLRFTNPRFEAPHGKYDWLNQSVFVGTLDVDFSQPHPICIRVFCLK